MRVPFADLKRATEALQPALSAAAERVIASGWYILGEEVQRFEHEFAAALGAEHAVGLASGTDAVEVALRALGIGPGDEVVTQANTCVPTVAGIERTGARPMLCDVEPAAGTMDPASLESAISPRTQAIVVVHLYGQCADLDALGAVAERHGIPLVEDCAQAHGARFRGRAAGTTGAISAFSFYPTKNLGALGDGGAVVTDDAALAERARLVRSYGEATRYEHVMHGVNSRLDELQAAILCAKLPHLAGWNERRGMIAARYQDVLAGTFLQPLAELPERLHAWHLFVARSPQRDAVRAALAERGIGTLVHYPEPIHGYEPFRELGNGPVPLTNSEGLAREVLSLPLYPELTDADVDVVVTALSEVVSRA